VKKVSAIVLAAGASRRLGAPKQLARLAGETLVHRAARAALASRCTRTLAVLGAHGQQVRAALADLAVDAIECADWEEGIAASIRAGIAALDASAEGALFLLADQPFVDSALLDTLLSAFDAPGIERVGTTYTGDPGVPAVFGREQFAALRALSGDSGARRLLAAAGPDRALVPSDRPLADLDTPEAAAELGVVLPLPSDALDQLHAHARSFLLTVRKDGSPTAHPMTALLDAGRLVFNTYRKSAKARNLERDPRLSAVLLAGYAGDAAGTPEGFEVRGNGSMRQRDGLPAGAVRAGATGATSASVGERVDARMKEGRRVEIDVEHAEIRRLELP